MTRADLSDRELIEQFVARVVVRTRAVDIEWQETLAEFPVAEKTGSNCR
jgi:hypothetical protein